MGWRSREKQECCKEGADGFTGKRRGPSSEEQERIIMSPSYYIPRRADAPRVAPRTPHPWTRKHIHRAVVLAALGRAVDLREERDRAVARPAVDRLGDACGRRGDRGEGGVAADVGGGV